MRKALLRPLLLLAAALLLPLAALGETRIMVVTDIHYLAPSLFEGSDIFLNALSRGDGKASQDSAELAQALADEARAVRPDLLLITGDLTFNGERQSHEELAALLRPLTEEGIRVAVIPGNHDINNMNAARWLPNGFRTVESPDSRSFREIWSGMLADEVTGPGFCGVITLEDCAVALGDYSIYEYGQASNGEATAKHVSWMERAVAAAREKGLTLLSASHQSLLSHTDFHDEAYRVVNGEEIVSLLTEAGCALNLSGHLHLQHIAGEGGFTDIATESFAMYPHRWGLVTVSEGKVTYEAHSLDTALLPDGLADTTREWFRNAVIKKLRPALEALDLTEEETNAMLAWAADLQEARFEGTLTESSSLWDDPARALWREKAGETAWAASVESTPEDAGSCLRWQTE